MIRPSSCAGVPRCTNDFSRFVKSRNSATPRMISGSTNENSIPKFAPLAGRPCQRSMRDREQRPSGTAMNIVMSDSLQALDDRLAQRAGPGTASRCGSLPPPPEREPLPDAARTPGVERERDRDQHRQDRPREVRPGERPRGSRLAPGVRGTSLRAAWPGPGGPSRAWSVDAASLIRPLRALRVDRR